MLVKAQCKCSKVNGLSLDARNVRRLLPEQVSIIELRPRCHSAFSFKPSPVSAEIASKAASPVRPEAVLKEAFFRARACEQPAT